MNINVNISLAGRYRLVAKNSAGEERVLADWFDNIVLDQGLDQIMPWDVTGSCAVGSGTNVPSATDVALQTQLAKTEYSTGYTMGAGTGTPAYSFLRKVFRFEAGEVSGLISEIGVGRINYLNPELQCFSRALVKDENGDAAAVQVGIDDTLEVTFEFRLYPSPVDVVGNFTIDGANYSYTLRAANARSFPLGQYGSASLAQLVSKSAIAADDFELIPYDYLNGPYDPFNPLDPLSNYPDGASTALAASTEWKDEYVSGTYYRDAEILFDFTQANFANGIKGISSGLQYQMIFSPAIPKTASNRLRLTLRLTWGR